MEGVLVKEDLEKRSHQAQLGSLDAELFGFIVLAIFDKDFDGWFVPLLFDQEDDLFLCQPRILDLLEEHRRVVILLLIEECDQFLPLGVDQLREKDALLLVSLVLNLEHIVDVQ